jgi:hypothetical protein
MDAKTENASVSGGVQITKLAGGVNAKAIFDCSADHCDNVRRDLLLNGCGLVSTHAGTQVATLLKALAYRGALGLNTYEGTAAGYARIATRIQDLEEAGWLIASLRESVIGPDGLFHAGIARYVLLGRNADIASRQGELDLAVPS